MSELRSIKCTHCAAPLTLHGGGHKIRTLNCQFCGSVLDARQHFSVLHQFSHQQPPDCPFKIGMQGKIKDITFTIIGMVAWEDAEAYQWIDLMLFSTTRGYAWMTYYDGHLVFSRRTRDIPQANLWNLAPKYKFTAGTREYQFFERSQASIVFVAGELTWIAHQGEQTHLIEAIAPPYLYAAEYNDHEMEYGLGEYIEDRQAVYDSFGVTEKPPTPSGIHPAQPYQSRFLEPIGKAARPYILVALIAIVSISLFFNGSKIYSEQLEASVLNEGAATREFTVTQPGRLLELTVDTRLSNAWAYFDVSVRRGPNDIFAFGTGVSYYEGRDSEGYWSEGSRSATAHFKVPEAGQYTLHIKMAEGGKGENGTTLPTTPLSVTLKQGYISPFYFILLLILSIVIAALGFFSRHRFEFRRWKSVLGDDE